MVPFALHQSQHVEMIEFKLWDTITRWWFSGGTSNDCMAVNQSKSSKNLIWIRKTSIVTEHFFNRWAVEIGAAAKPSHSITMARLLPVTERWAWWPTVMDIFSIFELKLQPPLRRHALVPVFNLNSQHSNTSVSPEKSVMFCYAYCSLNNKPVSFWLCVDISHWWSSAVSFLKIYTINFHNL